MKKQILYYSFAIAFIVCVFASANRVSAQTEPMTGGYGDTSVTDKDVKSAANFAVKTRAAQKHNGLKLVMIQKAEVQVVAGLNYRICMVVREGKGPTRTVTAVVYKDLKNHKSLSRWKNGGCSNL